MRFAFTLLLLPGSALAADIKSLVIHSTVPFQPNRAQSCSILTGNPPIEGGAKVKVEMYCSERTDFDPSGILNKDYPYTRICRVSLDASATKEFHAPKKWKVDLFCQAREEVRCQLR